MSELKKEAIVVMLPTETIGTLGHNKSKGADRLYQFNGIVAHEAVALHVCIRDRIELGDWYYNKACHVSNPLGPVIAQCEHLHEAHSCNTHRTDQIFKIIGTTDEMMWTKSLIKDANHFLNAPIPSLSIGFVLRYVTMYNDRKPIQKVMVQYDGDIPKLRGDELIINRTKTSWSVDEVREVFKLGQEYESLMRRGFKDKASAIKESLFI